MVRPVNVRETGEEDTTASKMTKRKTIGLAILGLAVVMLTLLPNGTFLNTSNPPAPRRLSKGDTWSYLVTYPDGETFMVNESVKDLTELNGTLTFVILRDDPQHISTEFLWITPDWREVKTFQPNIGNMNANTTVTYSPPLQLFEFPLTLGEAWLVNSSVTTVTELGRFRFHSAERLVEERVVDSVEEVSTSAGTFGCSKITVSVSGSVREVLWFDPLLAQIVRGIYFNGQEEVTQTLVAYSEAPPTSGFSLALYPINAPSMQRFRKL